MWECNNGGQLWTASATAGISTSGSLPSGFCGMGFSSLNTAFILSLLVDLVIQASSPRPPANSTLDVYVLFDMAFLEALGTLLDYERTVSWR